MNLYGEMHRFLPAIASEFGVDIVEHVVNHRARVHGTSKYGISRTIRVVLDLMTVKFLISYSTRPVQIFGLLGLGMGSFGVALLAWLTYVKYVKHEGIADRPLLLFGIMFVFAGIQLVDARPDGGDAGAHVSRIAGQTDLHHPGGPRDGVAANAGIERQVKTFGRRFWRGGAAGGSSVERLVRELADVSCACRARLAAGDRDKPSAGHRVDRRLGLARRSRYRRHAHRDGQGRRDAGRAIEVRMESRCRDVHGRGRVGAVARAEGHADAGRLCHSADGHRELRYGRARSRTSSTAPGPVISLHDSPKELGNLSMAFLGDFANSSVSPSTCVRDFSDGCRGKADEKSDIESNREHFVITELVAATAERSASARAA